MPAHTASWTSGACPNPQARDALLAGIRTSGWYGYFDHVNAAGEAGGFAAHLAELAAA